MIFDTIVLAGGRASRLDGASKAELVVGGRSLLSRSLDAAADSRDIIVVGTPPAVPSGVLVTRESPAFGGPAAAIAAGLEALSMDPPADFVLVLACDVPHSATAVSTLLARLTDGTHGVIAVDSEGRRQPLLGVYRAEALASAVRERGSDIQNLSVRALLSALDLADVPVPPGSTDDIDTWTDAAGFGISPPFLPAVEPTLPTKGLPMSDQDETATRAALADWSDRLSAALGIEGVEVDIDAVLTLAGTAAHAIMRPAAPLTTYLVGYAAGVAAGVSGGVGGVGAGVGTGVSAESPGQGSAGATRADSTGAGFTGAGSTGAGFTGAGSTGAGFTNAAKIATALAKSAAR